MILQGLDMNHPAFLCRKVHLLFSSSVLQIDYAINNNITKLLSFNEGSNTEAITIKRKLYYISISKCLQ